MNELADLQTCLVVLSAAGSIDSMNYSGIISNCLTEISHFSLGNVSATSFVQACQALSPHFNVAVATPNGSAPEFHYTDKSSEKWIRENRQVVAHPLAISDLIKSGKLIASVNPV